MTAVGLRSRFDLLIAQGRKPAGVYITSADPAVTIVAADSGLDFVLIDGEHGPLGERDVFAHITAARSVGSLSIVRVLEQSTARVQKAVDLGADAVLVPRVDSARAAADAVAATRYVPGGRGYSPFVPATRWSLHDWPAHAAASDREVVAIPLIETVAGVEAFEEIIAVDGIDHVFFGPGDLSQEMRVDLANEPGPILEVWERLRDLAHASGIRIGASLGAAYPGADFGMLGVDLGLLRAAIESRVASLRAQP